MNSQVPGTDQKKLREKLFGNRWELALINQLELIAMIGLMKFPELWEPREFGSQVPGSRPYRGAEPDGTRKRILPAATPFQRVRANTSNRCDLPFSLSDKGKGTPRFTVFSQVNGAGEPLSNACETGPERPQLTRVSPPAVIPPVDGEPSASPARNGVERRFFAPRSNYGVLGENHLDSAVRRQLRRDPARILGQCGSI